MTSAYCLPLLCTFETLVCSECNIVFAVDSRVREGWQTTGKVFQCPNGHSLVYRETEVTRLKKQLEKQERELTFDLYPELK
jgi:hypothetical protein